MAPLQPLLGFPVAACKFPQPWRLLIWQPHQCRAQPMVCPLLLLTCQASQLEPAGEKAFFIFLQTALVLNSGVLVCYINKIRPYTSVTDFPTKLERCTITVEFEFVGRSRPSGFSGLAAAFLPASISHRLLVPTLHPTFQPA